MIPELLFSLTGARSRKLTLVPVLLLLVCSLFPARSLPASFETSGNPAGKVLVLKGNVLFSEPATVDVPGETRYILLDTSKKMWGEISTRELRSGKISGGRLPSGIYVLFPADRDHPVRVRDGSDVKTDTGDVDDDGDQDIVITRVSAPARLLLNQGGTFVDHSERLPDVSGFATDVHLVDVNGDSVPDIFFTYSDEQNRLFINDGTGTFSDSTFSHLPVDSSSSQGACWGDVDDDGDNDIFVANLGVPFDPNSDENQLLINDGNGHFTDETATRFLFTPVFDISLDALMLDTDFDQDIDIVVIDDNTNGDQPRMLVNDGTGHFSDETEDRFPDSNGSCIRGSGDDLDGDDRADLYIANFFWEQNFLWMNDGHGTFYDETTMRTPHNASVDSAWSQSCDIADIDNDNDRDIIIANDPVVIDTLYEGRGRNRLLLNDGFGFFTDRTFQVFPDVQDSTQDIDFIDADGNTFIDIYVTNWGEPNLLLIDPGLNVGVESQGPGTPPVPAAFTLEQNYPNPFNPSTTIGFTIPSGLSGPASVSLGIYDLKGRHVVTLLEGELETGPHRVIWDGRDGRGMKVASGVYVARMTLEGRSRNIKMTLLK